MRSARHSYWKAETIDAKPDSELAADEIWVTVHRPTTLSLPPVSHLTFYYLQSTLPCPLWTFFSMLDVSLVFLVSGRANTDRDGLSERITPSC